jgi:hypothetical protein
MPGEGNGKQMNADGGVAPLPVHRVIDGLAAAGMEVQMLMRRTGRNEGVTMDELDEALARIERQLADLSDIAASMRDAPGG